jgi:pantoate--beta-alanine ligase
MSEFETSKRIPQQLAVPAEFRAECDRHRAEGRRIGFVPTMGFLHEGHLSLIRRARELADLVAVSIFVNPVQFGPAEDLERYPRDLPRDRDLCRGEGVELVFTPEVSQIYPYGYQTFVEVDRLSRGLCGDRRPGHFRGVATVVAKLFNIVGPCSAFFGEKDYQQLQVIRRMVCDLHIPVEVVACATLREADGLAMSSRNGYLQGAERSSATCLYRALLAIRERSLGAETLFAREAIAIATDIIEAEPGTRIDYIEVRDAQSLEPRDRVGEGKTVVALAVFVGRTRLIDNMVI